MIFPYQGSQILITDSMCDSNGHLNMVQHCQVLEDGCYGFQEDLGYTMSRRTYQRIEKGDDVQPKYLDYIIKFYGNMSSIYEFYVEK